MLPVALHIAEAIRAETRAGVHRDPSAERRPAVERHGRDELRALADRYPGTNDGVRPDHDAVGEPRTIADDRVRSDRYPGTEPDAASDDGRRMHSRRSGNGA